MKIAVISDLHLGTGRSDLFGHEESRFLRFLDHLEANFERVILLGDVFETLTVRPSRQVRELRLAREQHKAIVSRFEGDRYTYLHGNHDLVAGHVDGSPDTLRLEVDGVRLAFLHGHQFDWVVKKARFVSEWAAWLAGMAVRVGLRPVVRAAQAIEHLVMGVDSADRQRAIAFAGLPLTTLSAPPEARGAVLADAGHDRRVVAPKIDRFQAAAMGWAATHGVDVVVTGHTHCGLVAPHGDRLFLNSGSCSDGAFSYLAIDTGAGQYSVESTF